ncbi:hypothetical protein U9M48_040343 [Paspalum notatum var. saurae]|uniref:Uncharacterized protein n=1 Tax=Paspalum notatum var. saurae TaxID=547442 RepID=A0AAQ3ULL1_PASNO
MDGAAARGWHAVCGSRGGDTRGGRAVRCGAERLRREGTPATPCRRAQAAEIMGVALSLRLHARANELVPCQEVAAKGREDGSILHLDLWRGTRR